MKPLRFGIDLDGVIIDHRPHKLKLAAERGVALEPWQTNTNVMRQYVGEEAYRELQKPLYGELTPHAPAVEGALEFLAGLPGEAWIVSARDEGNDVTARAWLEKNRVHDLIPPERVIFCAHGREKGPHCERLGIDVFLDDKLSYLGHLPKSILRVLYDEDGVAWRLPIEPGIAVAHSWEEFAAIALERSLVAA